MVFVGVFKQCDSRACNPFNGKLWDTPATPVPSKIGAPGAALERLIAMLIVSSSGQEPRKRTSKSRLHRPFQRDQRFSKSSQKFRKVTRFPSNESEKVQRARVHKSPEKSIDVSTFFPCFGFSGRNGAHVKLLTDSRDR